MSLTEGQVPTPDETAVLRYTVREGDIDEHLALIADVYQELHTLRPSGFEFATYRLAGTNEFVEIASAPRLPGPLPTLPSFRRYRADLESRCSRRDFDIVTVVGQYPPKPLDGQGGE